jgi:cellulose synthase/poly-beta-1,6-N-acetylglucosamine synthase-like glycosyltransferase
LKQDYPEELWEIIVVDDHSIDGTVDIINNFILKEKPGNLRLLTMDGQHNSGKKAAIAHGISESSGDLILTTDADCRVGEKWISGMTGHFSDDHKMVFGPVSYFMGKGFWVKFQALEFLGLVASGAGAARVGMAFICNGANMAYRKDAFMQLDGFAGNERFLSGDDVFLLHKMKKAFGRRSIAFLQDPRSLVKTNPVKGLKAFIRQRIRWASKSKGYHDFFSILTAVIVFSYSLTVISSLTAGIFNVKYLLICSSLILLKLLVDLPLLIGITGFTGQRKLLRWYFVFQLIYPFYVLTAGVASLFPKKNW